MQRTSKELLNFLCMVLARLGGLLHYTTLQCYGENLAFLSTFHHFVVWQCQVGEMVFHEHFLEFNTTITINVQTLVLAGGLPSSNFLFFLRGFLLPPVLRRLCQESLEIPVNHVKKCDRFRKSILTTGMNIAHKRFRKLGVVYFAPHYGFKIVKRLFEIHCTH